MTLPKVKLKDLNKNLSKNQKILDKNVICHLCEVRFTQKKALYVHLRNKHNIEPLKKKQGTVQCPECKNMFYDKYNLRRHCRRAHGASPVREDKRLFLRGRIIDTSRKPRFILNFERYHSQKQICDKQKSLGKSFTCDTCQSTFNSKTNLIRHIGDVHAINQYFKCADCDEKFENKRMLLQHTHSVEKYNCLKEILPDISNYKYEVVQHVQIDEASFVAEIFCNLKNREEANQWLDGFQRKNKVTFRKMRRQCQSFDESYVFIVDRYRCQHNTLPKRRSTPHAKHTGCSATLFIRIYQHKQYIEWSWSRIRIKHTHNHLTDAAAKFRDPIEEVVDKFRSMFQAGKGPKAALKEHTKDLQLLYGDDVIADRGICPTSRWVYNFYRKMTKQRCENDKKKPKSGTIIESNDEFRESEIPLIREATDENDYPLKFPKLGNFHYFENQAVKNVPDLNEIHFTKSYTQTLVHEIPTDRIQICYDNLNTEMANFYQKNDFHSLPSSSTLSRELSNSRNSYSIQDKFQKPQSEMKRILNDFDVVISQIRSRISLDPVYFLNAMRNFIDTYHSSLRSSALLNSALYSFGKCSDFEINQL